MPRTGSVALLLLIGFLSFVVMADEPPPSVPVDLARIPHDTAVTVSAPVGAKFKIELRNRIPNAEYSIKVGNEQPTPIPAVGVNALIAVPASDAAAFLYTCPNLQAHPLGVLCTTSGGAVRCADDEEKVAKEVEKLKAAALSCGAVGQAVDKYIQQYTRQTIDGPFTRSVSLKIVRTSPPQVTWNPEVTSCDPVAQLAEFLKEEHPSDPMKVLAYDINNQLWSAYQWSGSGDPDPLDKPVFKRNPTGQPRLALVPDEKLTVVVVNVDPIAYTASTTERTRTAIEDLASLQQVATLFADFATGAFKIAGNPDFVVRTMSGTTNSLSNKWVLQGTAFREELPPIDNLTLRRAAKLLQERLDPYVNGHAREIDAVNKDAKAILNTANELTERTTDLASFVQRIEDRNVTTPGNFVTLPEGAKDLAGAIGTLAADRELLKKSAPKCADTLTAAAQIVELRLQGTPEKKPDQVALLNRYLALLNEITAPADVNDDDCLPANLREPIELLRAWLKSNPPPDELSPLNRATLVRIGQFLNVATAVIAKRDVVLTAANDVIAKQSALAKAISSLTALTTRPKSFQIADPCALAFGVIELPRPEGPKTTIPWSSVQTETIKIVPEAAFKDTVRLAHGETTAKYELSRVRSWTFDTDVALIYTDVVDPTFGLVKKTKADGTTEMVVDRVDETTHAGDLALLLTMHPRERVFGGQLGFGLNGYPAIFGGGAVQLGPYVKLNAGVTYQRVKTLAGDQKEGVTPLATKEEIRTKDKFSKGWYFGLSITVDDLPFFKKKT